MCIASHTASSAEHVAMCKTLNCVRDKDVEIGLESDLLGETVLIKSKKRRREVQPGDNFSIIKDLKLR
jgi:hypothetical protein